MKTIIVLIGILVPILVSAGNSSHYCLCSGPIRYGQEGEQIVFWLKRFDIFRGKTDYQLLKKFPTESACEAEMDKHNACKPQACY